MSERTAYIADHDHIIGALVVEIQDKNTYHFRQIQADSKGSFIDLGNQYNKDGSVDTIIPSAFILGDWHAGSVDPKAKKCWNNIIAQLCPEKLVIHDLFDGLSINHHEQNKNILRAQRAQDCKLDLSKELKLVAKDLDELSEGVDQVVIVKSNHDEFLRRYLEDGNYIKDPHNLRVALELAIAMIDGDDPLKYGVEKAGLKNVDKIRWLERDEDCKIARIQLGAHGDQGANGARGTLKSMEAAYGNSVTGHSHTPEILRGAYQVGTSSLLKLTYNQGPSSWLHTSCILYPNGARQLINSINGEYKIAT